MPKTFKSASTANNHVIGRLLPMASSTSTNPSVWSACTTCQPCTSVVTVRPRLAVVRGNTIGLRPVIVG